MHTLKTVTPRGGPYSSPDRVRFAAAYLRWVCPLQGKDGDAKDPTMAEVLRSLAYKALEVLHQLPTVRTRISRKPEMRDFQNGSVRECLKRW
jgi:hypothetical protein